ncbi:hypothetical protein DSECCO2_442110 [anaerobic digester metagenome]
MSKPFKCCYNCMAGMKFCEPPKTNPEYERVADFNSKKRLCGMNYKQPVYPMYEERHCKGFDQRTYGDLYTLEREAQE